MKRRDAMRALLAAGLASRAVFPGTASGQARIRRAIFVTGTPEKTLADWITGFRAGMKDQGYQEGRNITVDYRYGGVSRELNGQLAAEAVAGNEADEVIQ